MSKRGRSFEPKRRPRSQSSSVDEEADALQDASLRGRLATIRPVSQPIPTQKLGAAPSSANDNLIADREKLPTRKTDDCSLEHHNLSVSMRQPNVDISVAARCDSRVSQDLSTLRQYARQMDEVLQQVVSQMAQFKKLLGVECIALDELRGNLHESDIGLKRLRRLHASVAVFVQSALDGMNCPAVPDDGDNDIPSHVRPSCCRELSDAPGAALRVELATKRPDLAPNDRVQVEVQKDVWRESSELEKYFGTEVSEDIQAVLGSLRSKNTDEKSSRNNGHDREGAAPLSLPPSNGEILLSKADDLNDLPVFLEHFGTEIEVDEISDVPTKQPSQGAVDLMLENIAREGCVVTYEQRKQYFSRRHLRSGGYIGI